MISTPKALSAMSGFRSRDSGESGEKVILANDRLTILAAVTPRPTIRREDQQALSLHSLHIPAKSSLILSITKAQTNHTCTQWTKKA